LSNEREGKDTAIARTRRLLYVTCTRAKESLAVLAFTDDPTMVSGHVIAEGWFQQDEIVTL
jgi:DNA helicase-2/ATP-dependent DNA helicase PcrA